MNSTQKTFPLITDANQDNLNMVAKALEKAFGRSFVLGSTSAITALFISKLRSRTPATIT